MKFLVIAKLGDGISSVQVVEADDRNQASKIACKREGLVEEVWYKFHAYKVEELWDGFSV